MTTKRFTILYGLDEDPFDWDILDNEKDAIICQYNGTPICELLNELHEENGQLKFQLQNTSDQRDEFHRGARENANRVGKLEKENEQLRHDATILIQSNQDYRKENEQLKEQLTDCEKFRHTVFQEVNQEMMKQ